MTSVSNKKLKIFFYAVSGATGHENACIGCAQSLAKRGHQLIFLTGEQSKGKFEKFGFGEIILQMTSSHGPTAPPPPEAPSSDPMNQMKQMAELVLTTGLVSGKSSLEKAKIADFAMFDQLYLASLDFNPQIEKLIEAERPDLIVVDHFYIPPAIQQNTHAPWVLLFSGNPLAIYGTAELPPFSSGYPVDDSDRDRWTEFNTAHQAAFVGKIKHNQEKLNRAFNCEPTIKEYNFNLPSPHLNIYGFPAELDYDDVIKIPDIYLRVDAFCREETNSSKPFKLPEGFVAPGEKLIYFSMGTIGSLDVKLMRRILAAIAKTPYKCIVSKGALHDEYDLPANCWGEAFLPQLEILPLVDLVITHGGNNTVTESFINGKPMIVLPLFADQYDNAQRVHEKGYGIRLEPYEFEEAQLSSAIEQLINDDELKRRLEKVKQRVANENSKEKICLKLEALVNEYKQA